MTTGTSRGGGWVVGQFIIMALIVAAGFSPVGRYDTPAGLPYIGWLLVAVGLYVAWRGFADLGKNLTPFPKPLDGAGLVTTGIYAIVRHPIYSSALLLFLGTAVLQSNAIAIGLTGVLAVWFEFKSRREEVFLRATFPAYAAYMTRVKKFVPFVY